jgi:hypothetical protein
MNNAPSPINGLIAELEDCLGRVDATGQALAGAHLSSAIDSLKAAMIAKQSADRPATDRRTPNLFTFH